MSYLHWTYVAFYLMHHMDRMKMCNLCEDLSSGLVENALLLNCNTAALSLVLSACTAAP
jgi:hypothetical protein